MRRHRSRFHKLFTTIAASAALVGVSRQARAQACCAGTGAITPARLTALEVALVGVQVKGGASLGSFDGAGRYASSPSGASELTFEQDLFGALRVLKRGQVALVVPLVETRRTSQHVAETGGGLGDLNASFRYDFTLAGASSVIPGIAALAGITLPTGTPPDAASLGPLATGATGIGAFQLNVGAAVEQTFGRWRVNLTVIAAQRTARTFGAPPNAIHERLGAQWTTFAAVAYTMPSEITVAVSASYAIEGDATIDGVDRLGTAHRLPTLTLAGVLPLSDTWRLQGAIYDNPPIGPLGLNQPAGAGLLLTAVRSWM